MIEVQPLSETALAREQLRRMSDAKSSLHRVAHVLELIACSSVGLGEVLQDYSRQARAQLHNFLAAAVRVSLGAPPLADDREALQGVHYMLKAAKAVLQMTPAAMQRNMAETLGEKEKLSRAAITEILDDYLNSPDIACLLEKEDSGQMLAGLVTSAGKGPMAAGQERLAASAH